MVLNLTLMFLAALGILLLLWSLAGLFLRPRNGGLMIACCRGAAPELEQEIRSCSFLRGSGTFRGRLLVVDCGLTPEGRQLVQRLRTRYAFVDCCPLEALEDYLQTVNRI